MRIKTVCCTDRYSSLRGAQSNLQTQTQVFKETNANRPSQACSAHPAELQLIINCKFSSLTLAGSNDNDWKTKLLTPNLPARCYPYLVYLPSKLVMLSTRIKTQQQRNDYYMFEVSKFLIHPFFRNQAPVSNSRLDSAHQRVVPGQNWNLDGQLTNMHHH